MESRVTNVTGFREGGYKTEFSIMVNMLQGYPDTYEIPVSNVQAYKQFGNSVCVPVIEAIAKEMRK